MEHSFIQLIDLPDEILMTIFKKLNDVAVLYSLIGVNLRLNRFLCDPVFTGRLTLLKFFSNGFIVPLSSIVLDRFCSEILPEIHHTIKWLDLESLTMERILLAVDYPILRGLGLYNIEQETAVHFFTGDTLLSCTFKNQVSALVITISNNKEKTSVEDTITTVCTHIFTVFPNLLYLNFHRSSRMNVERLSFDRQLPTFFSPTLLELHIKVQRFDDILYLLYTCFNQLRIFYVNTVSIVRTQPPSSTINTKKKLLSMKCFSLTAHCETRFYDELIIPLLQRMSNLEKLVLNFAADCQKTFIDGNNLKMNIINHMPRLDIFAFNIRSEISSCDQMHLVSNEDIKNTFKDLGDFQINCCVDYFPNEKSGQCHIYSYPYTLRDYDNITNNFSGGLFKYVHKVSLFDERPFEHEFFIRITQAFPFLKRLTVRNWTPQSRQRDEKSDDSNQDLPIIKYSHLNDLDFIDVHDDYVEQFLLNTKTCLSNYIHMMIDYDSLQRVTHNFTRDATRANCAKFSRIIFCDVLDLPKHLEDYFPHAEIVIF